MAHVRFRETMQTLTGVARPFGVNELIVSKTDLKGHITYANEVFCASRDTPRKRRSGRRTVLSAIPTCRTVYSGCCGICWVKARKSSPSS